MCQTLTAVSKGQQSEPQLSRSPPAPVALPPIRGPQPLPTTSSEVPALVEVSEAQPAASDPMSSAAATAQLLLALSSSKSPGGQLQQGTGLATVQLLRQGQASQEDQEQLSPRKLPPISHPSAKRRCIGSQEPPKAPPVLAVDMHRPPCSAREQAQHGPVPVTHPVASKQSHSVEGVGSCGQGFRAYASMPGQHAASQKQAPASTGGPASQLLQQSSSPSRLSTLTHAILAGSGSGNGSGTTNPSVANLQHATSAEMTMQPSMSVPSRLAPISSSQLAGMDSAPSGGSSNSGNEAAAAPAQEVARQGGNTGNSMLPEAPPLRTDLPQGVPRPSGQPRLPCPTAGILPFWNASKDHARENQEAEMAAFCEAYTRAANAARGGGGKEMQDQPAASSMQHQHMMHAMRSHAMYQQHMMMHHFMMGMHSGSRAGAEQPAWPLCAGWPMPGLAMPHGQFPPFAPPGPFMPGTMHSTPSAFHNAALLRPAAACGTVSHCASGMSHPASSLPRAASTGTDPSQAPSHGHPPTDALGKQLLRDQALRKYKLKRQNLTYSKKIRYESRKQLAKTRPRVKGQFVRMDSADAADMEAGTDESPEAGADVSKGQADSLQEAADQATEGGMQSANGRQQAACMSAVHRSAFAGRTGLLQQSLSHMQGLLAGQLPC